MVGTWLLRPRLPSDIGRSSGGAVVGQVRSRSRQGTPKRQSVSSARLGKTHSAVSNGVGLNFVFWHFHGLTLRRMSACADCVEKLEKSRTPKISQMQRIGDFS